MPKYTPPGMQLSPESKDILDEAKEREMNIFPRRNPNGSYNEDYPRMMSVVYRIKKGKKTLDDYDENWRCGRAAAYSGSTTMKMWMEQNTGYNVYSSKKSDKLTDDVNDDEHDALRGYGRARRARMMIESKRWKLTDYDKDYRLLPDRPAVVADIWYIKRQSWKCKRKMVVKPVAHEPEEVFEIGDIDGTLPEVPSWCLERYEPRWKLQLQETPEHLIFG